MKFFSAVAFCLISTLLVAQNKADLFLMQQATLSNSKPIARSIQLLPSKNPLTFPFRFSLYFYQTTISTQWQTDCAHYPSCSNFAKQSIARFGFTKGVFLASDRLSRCSSLGLLDYRFYESENEQGFYIDLPLYYYLKQ